MITIDGYVIPIKIRDGLARIDMRKPTQDEFDSLPHVLLTSDDKWDPTVIDDEFLEFHDVEHEFPEAVERTETRDPRVDGHGFLRTQNDYQVLFAAQDQFIEEQTDVLPILDHDDIFYDARQSMTVYYDDDSSVPPAYYPYQEYSDDDSLDDDSVTPLQRKVNRLFIASTTFGETVVNRKTVNRKEVKRKFPDLDACKPCFGWISNEKIKTMLDKTDRKSVV